MARKLEVEGNPSIGYICPGSGEVIVQVNGPEPEDMLETTPAGGLWARAETREFCRLLHAAALRAGEAGLEKEQLDFLRELVQHDATDVQDARSTLVLGLLDANEPAEARALLEAHAKDGRCAMAYSRALVEFISWALLEEEGSTEATAAAARAAAVAANPFAAVFIVHGDAFTARVDPEAVDEELGTRRPGGGTACNPGTVRQRPLAYHA